MMQRTKYCKGVEISLTFFLESSYEGNTSYNIISCLLSAFIMSSIITFHNIYWVINIARNFLLINTYFRRFMRLQLLLILKLWTTVWQWIWRKTWWNGDFKGINKMLHKKFSFSDDYPFKDDDPLINTKEIVFEFIRCLQNLCYRCSPKVS